MAGLTEDAKGNLYGTASYGGNDSDITCNYRGCGVVFKLNTAGTTFKTLYTFQGSPDGQGPQGVLVRDAKGNLYGTTAYGGTIGVGTVFELSPAGNETAEYSFTDGPAMYGGSPLSGVIRDSAGNLYGTTASGDGSGGVVYKLDTSGNETPLFFFPLNPSEYGVDGAFPLAPLTRDAAGNLYGTTTVGGTGDAVGNCPVGCGVVFKVDTAGNTTVLHNFAGPEGNEPVGGVIQDAAGNLYGTTTNGGTGQFINGCGVVFKLTPAGKLKVLYNFTGGTDGAGPWAGLACERANLDKPCPISGYLYGSTRGGFVGGSEYGTLFSIKYRRRGQRAGAAWCQRFATGRDARAEILNSNN
jgi:uncharacterized repeat protein (TIGR03803 family)